MTNRLTTSCVPQPTQPRPEQAFDLSFPGLPALHTWVQQGPKTAHRDHRLPSRSWRQFWPPQRISHCLVLQAHEFCDSAQAFLWSSHTDLTELRNALSLLYV